MAKEVEQQSEETGGVEQMLTAFQDLLLEHGIETQLDLEIEDTSWAVEVDTVFGGGSWDRTKVRAKATIKPLSSLGGATVKGEVVGHEA